MPRRRCRSPAEGQRYRDSAARRLPPPQPMERRRRRGRGDGGHRDRPRSRVHGPDRPLAPIDDRPRSRTATGSSSSSTCWPSSTSVLAPFRILTGMEVDILEDGALDLDEDLLGRLDVVVASVHSKLRMEQQEMTQRMLLAVGIAARRHPRPLHRPDDRPTPGRSTFDADVVFAACKQFETAVEINCRPERLDPPGRAARPRRRLRLLVLDRLRRPRHRPARVAAPRLRPRRGARRSARPSDQHLAGRRAARLDRAPPEPLTGTPSSGEAASWAHFVS